MSRPRSTIAAILEPGGMSPGGGTGPGYRLASASQSALGAGGTAVATSAPDGRTSTGATVTSESGVGVEPHAATTATTTSTDAARGLTETPGVAAIIRRPRPPPLTPS